MRALFARRHQAATGPLGVAALWSGTLLEILGNASLVHLDILNQDLGYTVRVLRRMPGFAATAILTVALGIGATTAAFSVTDFVLIRPLPFPGADRLVKVWEKMPGYSRMELSAANYRDWKKAATSFESMGMYHDDAVNLMGRAEPLRLVGASVSADLFPTLGVAPVVGRTFSESDDRDRAPGTIILSYRLWQTEFGGDPAVLGQSVVLDNAPFTVIGVMSREFHFPASDVLFWKTNRFGEASYRDRTDNWLEAVGRLRPGVTLEQARAEMLASPNSRSSSTAGRTRTPARRCSRLATKCHSGRGCCCSRCPRRRRACSSSPARTSRTCC
jgi:hypothetical protein